MHGEGGAIEDWHTVSAATICGAEENDQFQSGGLRESSNALVISGVYRLTTEFPPLFKRHLVLLGK